MKKATLLLAVVFAAGSTFAQKKMVTTSATIGFDATTSLDKLPKAENKTAIASLDSKTGAIAFEATIKNFGFSNPKIQEHFNQEGWMNSDKFPTASFKGKITNPSAVNFKKDGTYTAAVAGELSMHGETKPVNTTATFVVEGKKVTASSDFVVSLADYKVEGPAIGAGKVAKDPKISVVAEFK
jgi:polyisoprenoid-binding protein YceI